MPSARRSVVLGLVAGVLAAAGFSLKAVLAKLAYRAGTDATTLLTLRMLYALPFYGGLFAFATRGAEPLGRSLASRTAAVGILGYFFASYFDFQGLVHVSAGLERLVLYLYPTMVLVIARVAFGRGIRPRQIGAAIVAYLGLAVALSSEAGVRPTGSLALGVGYVLLSAATYAGYVVGSGELVARVGSLRFTSLAMLAATVPMFATFAGARGFASLARVPLPVHELALAMALFATVIPSLLMTEGIRRLGAGRAALVGSIGPLMTMGLEASLLGERVTSRSLVGMALVVGGVLYGTFGKEEKAT